MVGLWEWSVITDTRAINVEWLMPIRVVMNKQSISILSLLLLCLSWEAGAYDEKDLGKPLGRNSSLG